jgi:endonuclease/exonuclease/phosphatase family metal-dependent hydrolase
MKSKPLIIPCLFAGMLIFACTQKEEPEPVPVDPQETVEPGESSEYSYTFKLKNEGEEGTKSIFEQNYVMWENGDLIAAYASTSKNKYTEVEVNGDDVTMTIRSTVALSAGDMVYAYAPFNKVNNEAEATAITLDIPRNQVSGTAAAMPMVALPFELTGAVDSYTDTEVGTLQFMNLGSVIKLNIYKSSGYSAGEKIENVTFQAGTACAGSFTYDITSVNANSMTAISGYTETDVVVSANGTNPVTVGSSKDNGAVFYMVVAPGTYSGSFVIRTNAGDYTYVSGSSREYKRATIKPLNLDLSSANWTPVMGGYDNSIDSPRELAAFLAGTSSSDTGTYNITADLDMTGYTITSASGFGGTLNGNDHSIKNLTSSVPLFATNSGTIQNLTIDGSCTFTASSNTFAPLVSEDSHGTYTSVRNRASVTYTAAANVTDPVIIGGLVALSVGGTYESCTNWGAVTFDATGYSHKATSLGGLVGLVNNKDSGHDVSFDSCINYGHLTIQALYGDPNSKFDNDWDCKGINMGGILGTCVYGSSRVSFESCQNATNGTITFRHAEIDQLAKDENNTGPLGIGGIMGLGDRANFNKCKNYALIDVKAKVSDPDIFTENESTEKKRRNYIMKVGGISGYGWDVTGSHSSCTNEGNIEVDYDALYSNNDEWRAAVGGICGSGYRNNSDGYANYCKQRGDITISGRGVMAVGGIIGYDGTQIANTVEATCHITVNGLKGDVGGLVGYMEADNGKSNKITIKGCKCYATIFADSIWGEYNKNGYWSLGGLIGRWKGGSTGSYPSLSYYSGNDSPCIFDGSVSSVYQDNKVGLVVGYSLGSGPVVFGNDDHPIQASGSITRKELSTTTINASNVETYAIGRKDVTTTIYVESPTPAPVPAANLTLMTFNIREGSNWTDRKSPIVSMINGESPDIIGLQEVKDLDVFDLAEQGKHPWNYLKDNLSAYTGYRNGSNHNAILYKTSTVELSNTGIFFLRDDYNTSGNSWDGYERTALYATVREKATGKDFFYITTHFPMNDNNDGWQKSTALLENRIAALNTNNYPVILMGDFNCVIGNACWDGIKTWMNNTRYSADTIVSTENRDLYTYNAFGDSSKARNKVDHIWVSKSGINVDSYVTLTNAIRSYGGYTTNGETFLSDHYPIIAHIS